MSHTVRVELPQGLSALAGVGREVRVTLAGPVTAGAILDALEMALPMLTGTIRDRVSGKRRPFVRFFACQQDFSHLPPDRPLPPDVADGREAFSIVGAIAGG
jgi:hypothetical protein